MIVLHHDPDLDERARVIARECAEDQCEVAEIVATLETELEWTDVVGTMAVREGDKTADVQVTRAAAWTHEHADEITRARLYARRRLRKEIHAHVKGDAGGTGWTSSRLRLCEEMMRQHAGWAKQAPIDEIMAAFLAAQRKADREIKGGKLQVAK